MPQPQHSNTLAAAGLLVGLLCLATLYCIAAYGPGSYSSSGSATLMSDGTIAYVHSRPLLPRIAQAAFFGFLIPLVLGIASLLKKEKRSLGLAALAYGFAPVLIYTIGTLPTAMLYFAVTLPAVALYIVRRFAQDSA